LILSDIENEDQNENAAPVKVDNVDVDDGKC
jgi:hypothetical protein